MVLQLLASAVVAAVPIRGAPATPITFPTMTYRFTSFAVPNPSAAATFLTQYTGAEQIKDPSQWLAHRPLASDSNASVVALRMWYANKTAHSDLYFVRDPHSRSGTQSVDGFNSAISAGHTFAQDDWDWWQDWHLAFLVSDIDAVALRLMKDGIPFVSRGSLYFQIPGTAVTIQILGEPTLYWTEHFLFCRRTDNDVTGRMRPYTLNVTDIVSEPERPLPEFIPSHHSFTATDAQACSRWALSFLAVTKANTHTAPKDGVPGSHAFANGTCADIQWVQNDDGFQLHFIQQFRKREGRVRVRDHETFLRDLHGNLSDADAYWGFRTGFSVTSIAPYVAALRAAGEPHAVIEEKSAGKSMRRLVTMAPSGTLIELQEDTQTSALPKLNKVLHPCDNILTC